jgi:hypothetical protein
MREKLNLQISIFFIDKYFFEYELVWVFVFFFTLSV